jgi:hypothetical protein
MKGIIPININKEPNHIITKKVNKTDCNLVANNSCLIDNLVKLSINEMTDILINAPFYAKKFLILLYQD